MFYYKLDKNGNLIWKKVIDNTYGEAVKQIEDKDEYIIVGGSSNSELLTSNGITRGGILFMEIDGTGDIKKAKVVANDQNWREGLDVKVYEKDYIVSGVAGISGEDNYLLRFNENMNMAWSRTTGGSGRESLKKVVISNGQIIVAGMTLSNDFDGMTKPGEENVYIAKYNMDGSLVWQKIVGSNRYEYLCDMKETADGGFAIVGTTAGTDFMGQKIDGVNEDFSFIVKFDKDGNVY